MNNSDYVLPALFNETLSELENQTRILKHIVAYLRSSDGCPWDRKQTLHSLSEYVLEESYEAIEAIENNDFNHIQEELGDMLSQIFMIAQIADELKKFSIIEVFTGINKKLITRHPHVFKNEKVENPDEALLKWNEMKLKEKKDRISVLDGIPKNLPALLYAMKAIRKNRLKNEKKGDIIVFPFPSIQPESLSEEEIGKLLYSITELCEKKDINPESLLKKTTEELINKQKKKGLQYDGKKNQNRRA